MGEARVHSAAGAQRARPIRFVHLHYGIRPSQASHDSNTALPKLVYRLAKSSRPHAREMTHSAGLTSSLQVFLPKPQQILCRSGDGASHLKGWLEAEPNFCVRKNPPELSPCLLIIFAIPNLLRSYLCQAENLCAASQIRFKRCS